MITVVCVLRPSADFDAEKVQRLKYMVDKYYSCAYDFLCFTNEHVPKVETIPFVHNWRGWYSKLELFRKGVLSGQVVYLDLDTVLVGDVTDIFDTKYEFATISAWKNGKTTPVLSSAFMMWDADQDLSVIHDSFKPSKILAYEQGWERWGDQGFLQDHLPCRWSHVLETEWPGRVMGFKHHIWGNTKNEYAAPPKGASVVCFSGKPRPWKLPADSPIGRAWRGESI